MPNYQQNPIIYLNNDFQVSTPNDPGNMLKILQQQNNNKTTTTYIGFRDDDSYARRLKKKSDILGLTLHIPYFRPATTRSG